MTDPWTIPTPQPVQLGGNAPGSGWGAQWLCIQGDNFRAGPNTPSDPVAPARKAPEGYMAISAASREYTIKWDVLSDAVKAGEIPSIQEHRCTYVRAEDVEAWKAGRKRGRPGRAA